MLTEDIKIPIFISLMMVFFKYFVVNYILVLDYLGQVSCTDSYEWWAGDVS